MPPFAGSSQRTTPVGVVTQGRYEPSLNYRPLAQVPRLQTDAHRMQTNLLVLRRGAPKCGLGAQASRGWGAARASLVEAL